MTGKRCTDCRHTKGIGYDFWCGEGHTEYEVFGAETNCPYYEYHDWSKGVPSMTAKRFEYIIGEFWDNVSDKPLSFSEIEKKINALNDENEQLKNRLDKVLKELYCKDRKLEELNVDIECCDKND